jgi:hypothetical protein
MTSLADCPRCAGTLRYDCDPSPLCMMCGWAGHTRPAPEIDWRTGGRPTDYSKSAQYDAYRRSLDTGGQRRRRIRIPKRSA